MNSALVTKYSGPPGTGKSTTLLNAVDSLLTSGIKPEDIIFTTFTRAGAYEARDRACLRFNFPVTRFPYFKTLHALCYQLLPKRDIMGWANWAEVGRSIGVSFTTKYSPDEPVPRGSTKGDYLMSLWSLARVMRLPPQQVFERREQWISGFEGMNFVEFEHFISTVHAYKQAHGRIDFTDMLEEFLVHGPQVRPHTCIVDEAQDLSKIQWEVVEKLCQGANVIMVAGDDDQCIHEWNGAFPQGFIELRSESYTVLPQSYRIPSSVHKVAEEIIAKVQTRLPKTYKPREEAGLVNRIDGLHQTDLTKGTWLLLARNLAFLEFYVEHCRQQGLLWSSSSVPCVDPEILQAIKSWQKIRTTELPVTEIRVMYKYLSSGDRIKRGYKKAIEAAKDELKLTHAQLVKDFGLLCAHDLPWASALDAIPPEDKNFLVAVERKGGLEGDIRIQIGTIHSAKGKEADHVVLNPNLGFRTHQAFERNPDAEHRVFYVAVTRARQSLHILHPTTELFYPI